MTNNWFDIEITTTTKKKWNISIIIIFPLLIILSILTFHTKYNYLFIIWIVIAAIFLIYEFIHSKSLVELSTRLLFKDDCFDIVIEDNHFKLEIKKEEVTNIRFDKKTNHVVIFNNDKILYEFNVKSKTLDELIDTFNSFGYNCEISEYI